MKWHSEESFEKRRLIFRTDATEELKHRSACVTLGGVLITSVRQAR